MIGVSRARPVRQEVGLLQLRHRADLGRRAGWLVPRRLRHADTYRTDANMILSTYPKHVLQEEGSVDDATATSSAGVEDVGLQAVQGQRRVRLLHLPAGHLDGVPARRRRRRADRQPVRQDASGRTGFGMAPDLVEQHLLPHGRRARLPGAAPAAVPQRGPGREFDALCAGGANFNGFYGYGIVDAYAAVKTPLKPNARPYHERWPNRHRPRGPVDIRRPGPVGVRRWSSVVRRSSPARHHDRLGFLEGAVSGA